nr:MAG TPA: Thymidylate synthase thyX [Bacteriophage sp.]
MYFSKRSWTREMESHIREVCDFVMDRHGHMNPYDEETAAAFREYNDWMTKLLKWGVNHTTMLEFIDLSFTVEGLHRAGMDDWDSHAKRYNNRIIRSSTRLSTFGVELSDYYKGKIVPTEVALTALDMKMPARLFYEGQQYVWTPNGYVLEEMKDNKDVLRGLYRLCIPSNFIFKCDLANYAHVIKQRGAHGTANPEVKLCAEAQVAQLTEFQPLITKDFLMQVKM